ncbi:MAG: NnrU protein, partial [Pseudomonadales bacterium]|nr:NnrU protein [Pseudomonadales bacterium]
MSMLILASLAFLLTHLGMSSTPLRGALVNGVGENGFLGLYTIISFATLGAMIYTWLQIEQSGAVWVPGMAATAVARALIPFSFILIVAGVMAKNPTSVKMDAAVNEESVDGILKISRHPLQWGIFLWAVVHVIGNGDQASIVLFGTF